MNYTDLFEQGMSEYLRGNISRAIAIFNSVEPYFKDNCQFYITRGNTYCDNNEYDKSIPDYTKAIKLNPSIAEYYSNRAKSYFALSQTDEAFNDICKAIEIEPKNPHFYEVRGMFYASLDNYIRACDDLNYVILKEPHNVNAKQHYLYMWDKINEGYAEFQPSTSKEFTLRGMSKLFRGLFIEAIVDFDIAIDQDPINHKAIRSKGVALLLMEKYGKAIKAFHAAIEIEPCAEYLDNLADAYQKSGNLDISIQYFNEAIKLSSEQPRIIFNRGVVFAKAKNYHAAIRDFNRVIELESNFPNPYNSRAWCYKQLGMEKEARVDKIKYLELMQRYESGLI